MKIQDSRPALDPEARAELQWLNAALRAHLEWQAANGTSGLPKAAPLPLPAREAPSRGKLERHPGFDERVPLGGSTQASPASEVRSPRGESAAEVPRHVPQTGVSRDGRLSMLANQIQTCTRCRLHSSRTQTVFARGTGSSGLCFVGEGPGAEEDARGAPFVGKAGQLLDRMIQAMGLSPEEVYVCNIVKCRPPDNRKPEPDEMAACLPYLSEQLELLDPQIIVALGATAVQGLLGTNEGIMRLRGRWKLYRGRVAVMPTFHPAYLLRNPEAKREVWEDLQAVLRQMGRAPPVRK